MARKTPIERYRNIGVMAHIDAGKTTTTERILFYTGVSHKLGEVHDGAATMDWMEQEQERGITITSAATTCFWKGMENNYPDHRINIIDTPGTLTSPSRWSGRCASSTGLAPYFVRWAECSLRPKPYGARQTNTRFRGLLLSTRWIVRAPISCASMSRYKRRLKAHPVPVQLPIGAEDKFEGVIDLIKMRAIYWDDASQGMRFEERDIPADLVENAKLWREKMVETAAEANEELMDKYLEEGDLSVDDIKQGLRIRTISNEIVPMLCGSAFKNKGVQAMLDAVLDYLPSPVDIQAINGEKENGEPGERHASDEEPFAGLAFKIATDPYVGQLIFFRVYSGVVSSGDTIYNPVKGRKERIGRLLQMHANQREEIKEVRAGDIAAAVGLKEAITGDTLC